MARMARWLADYPDPCQSTGDKQFFLTINLDKRCVIDTQPRAGKSYFEEKKKRVGLCVTGATDNL